MDDEGGLRGKRVLVQGTGKVRPKAKTCYTVALSVFSVYHNITISLICS